MLKPVGKERSDLLAWLAGEWLREGPAVCFVEGFSGSGKTTLARELPGKAGPDFTVVPVDMPETESNQIDDLLFDLATALSDHGIEDVAQAIDTGSDLVTALVRVLRHQPVVIVIDEFQRAFIKGSGEPSEALKRILRRVSDLNPPGRLLLLTNEVVNRGRWSEHYKVRLLPELAVEEAEALLDEMLTSEGRSAEVPPDRRRDVVNWLGCNPRAIRVLVASLAQDSLNYLIGLNPESWELRDREVSPDLLRQLEKELLERTLGHLTPEADRLLRMLSVHRKDFERFALETAVPRVADLPQARGDLFSRFLIEQHQNWYSLNEVAREIARQRLKEMPSALKQAHSKAADYYTRHFRAQNITGGGRLGAHFVEARYHLVQAGREADLTEIAHRFGGYIQSTINHTTPVPKNADERDEKIALLSALLESQGPKTLEYYLARLLKARGGPGDLERALTHAQRATGPTAIADVWVLRIELESQLNGADAALQVTREGIARVPVASVFPLYPACGELLAREGRIEEAIDLLKDGIARVPVASVFPLYPACGELLAREGRIEEAIDLLKDGIARVPADKNLHVLYQYCGKLLSRDGQVAEAIKILREGMRALPFVMRARNNLTQSAIYLCAAERDDITLNLLLEGSDKEAVEPEELILGRVFQLQMQQQWQQAAEIARKVRDKFTRSLPLAAQEAFSWLCAGDAVAADEAIESHPLSVPITEGNRLGWLRSFIAFRNNQQEKARKYLTTYLGRPLADNESADGDQLLYLWDNNLDTAFHFPTLPPSLTGLAAPVTRPQYGPPVLPTAPESPRTGAQAAIAPPAQSAQNIAERDPIDTRPTIQSKVLRIVVASPGDVQAERDTLEDVMVELNRGIAAVAGLRLELARWETDAFPGFHPEGPQGLIDPILRIEDCDLLIGIFWKRFDTPAADTKSTTEHEFRTAYAAWKKTGRPQIMVYFNQKPSAPASKADTDQWGRVLEFKRDFPQEGLWWSYNGKAQFERLARNHLTQFIRQRVPTS